MWRNGTRGSTTVCRAAGGGRGVRGPSVSYRDRLPGSTASTRETYCPRCGEVTTVVRTVPCQPDVCRDCGADVPRG